MKVEILQDYWTLMGSDFDLTTLTGFELDFLKTYKKGEIVNLTKVESYQNLFDKGYIKIHSDDFGFLLRELYDMLTKIFNKYIDSTPENCKIWAMWIISSKIYQEFSTFPYLLLNAGKRSGKSRLLRLSAFLLDSVTTTSLTEAVMFRLNKPLFFDEAENLDRKEKKVLSELLNFAYKKGGKILRAEKIRTKKSEGYLIKEFDVFKPVMLANISGLSDVLNDRCITLVLKRSVDPEITKRLELFEYDKDILEAKVLLKNLDTEQIKAIMNDIYSYLNDSEIESVNNVSNKIIDLVERSSLTGREFELWLPLLIVAALIDDSLMEEIHQIAVENQRERGFYDSIENIDILVLQGLAANFIGGMFYAISELTKKLREKVSLPGWITEKWLGRFLKRTQIIEDKRRMRSGVEVTLNMGKIQELLDVYTQTTMEPNKNSDQTDEKTTQTTPKLHQNYTKTTPKFTR